jgi:hypothetical protein
VVYQGMPIAIGQADRSYHPYLRGLSAHERLELEALTEAIAAVV